TRRRGRTGGVRQRRPGVVRRRHRLPVAAPGGAHRPRRRPGPMTVLAPITSTFAQGGEGARRVRAARRPAVATAALGVALTAAVTAIATARPAANDQLDAVLRPDAPLVVEAQPRTRAPRTPVTVTVTLAASAHQVRAPAWSGTVTAVHVGEGASLAAGDPVLD